MNTLFRTVITLCMVFVLLCVPCMASCPYAAGGAKTCGAATCNGSDSCSGGSSIDVGGSSDVYGAFKCTDGTCTAKVCDGESCESTTFTASNGDNSVKSWLLSLFGGSEVSEETDSSQEASTCSSNFYGSFAEKPTTSTPVAVEEEDNTTSGSSGCSSCGTTTCTDTCNNTCTTDDSGNCSDSVGLLQALRADVTERAILSSTYTSENFAESLCANMTAKGYECSIVKVTFTDGKYNYINSFKTCDGTLLVDSCGTALGTGIKKEVTVLEVGKQWEAKSLAGTCSKVYTRGTVSNIEYL